MFDRLKFAFTADREIAFGDLDNSVDGTIVASKRDTPGNFSARDSFPGRIG
jgi:hypothetical protein